MAFQRTITGSRHRLKDKKVHLAVKSRAQDDTGGWVTETRYATPSPTWAYVRQLSTSERETALAIGSNEELAFFVNWSPVVVETQTPNLYVVYKGKAYKCVRVDWYEGYKRDVALYVETPEKGNEVDVDAIKPYRSPGA